MPPFFFIAFLALLGAPLAAWANPDAASLLTSQQQPGFHDQLAHAQLNIKDGAGKNAATRALEIRELEAGSQIMIRIKTPADLAGTALLGKGNADGTSNLWLFLPTVGHTKRLVGSDQKASFLGSEFSYEDFMLHLQDSARAELLPPQPCGSTTCDVVTVPRGSDSLMLWIRRDNHQFDRVIDTDSGGKPLKTALFLDYRKVADKFWRPFLLRMTNDKSGRQTELVIQDIQIPAKLNGADFSPSALERY